MAITLKKKTNINTYPDCSTSRKLAGILEHEAGEKDPALLEKRSFWLAWLFERGYKECGKPDLSWNEECLWGIRHTEQIDSPITCELPFCLQSKAAVSWLFFGRFLLLWQKAWTDDLYHMYLKWCSWMGETM